MPVPLKASAKLNVVSNGKVRRSTSLKAKTKTVKSVKTIVNPQTRVATVHLGTPFHKRKMKETKIVPFSFNSCSKSSSNQAQAAEIKAKDIVNKQINQPVEPMSSSKVNRSEKKMETQTCSRANPKDDTSKRRYKNLFS